MLVRATGGRRGGRASLFLALVVLAAGSSSGAGREPRLSDPIDYFSPKTQPVVLGAGSSSGAGREPRSSDPIDYLSPKTQPVVRRLRDRAATIRASLESRSLESRVRGLLAISGVAAPAATPPAAGAAPLDSLAAAARLATAMLEHAPAVDVEAALAAMTAHDRSMRVGASRVDPLAGGLDLPRRWVEGQPSGKHWWTPRESSHGTAASAALLIARAVDAALPGLQASAGARAAATGESSGCDVLDRLPTLCVGSDASNAYTEQAAVTVDFGGDDVYRGAGAAVGTVKAPENRTQGSVSIVIDLAGNDRYAATRVGDTDLVLGSGSAFGGAVGFVVDLGGDDVHTASVPKSFTSPMLVAQGAALEGGVGLLFDAGGADRYEATIPSGTQELAAAIVQGAGWGIDCGGCDTGDYGDTTGSIGALIESGMGDDRYSLAAGTGRQPNIKADAERIVFAQGAGGKAGTGVLADDGGADSLTATIGMIAAPHDRYPIRRGDPIFDPTADAQLTVQGASEGSDGAPGGIGVLLGGVGPTRYDARIASSGFVKQMLVAHGVGFHEGTLGILDDIGGDDVYRALAKISTRKRITVTDRCDCSQAKATVIASNNFEGEYFDGSMPSQLWVQGGGFFEGEGLIADHSGDDTYVAENLERLRVVLRDRLSRPKEAPKLEVVGYDPPLMFVQGAGITGGSGVIADDGGSDVYTVRSNADVSGVVHARRPAGPPRLTVVAQETAFQNVQGASDAAFLGVLGALLDAGGKTDRITASSEKRATAAPDGAGALEIGSSWPQMQGAGAQGALVALGQDPRILSSPSRPIGCAGPTMHRGFGTWSECRYSGSDPPRQAPDGGSQPFGIGFAPDARGSAATLEPTSAMPRAATEAMRRIPVEARLRDPNGKPIAGAVLRFDLQVDDYPDAGQATYDMLNNRWLNIFEVDAVTDARGVARSSLPVSVNGVSMSGLPFRVAVTFDGATGIYPSHIARVLDLTLGDVIGPPFPKFEPLPSRRSYAGAIDDPLVARQWGPARIHALEAWRQTHATGFRMRVAVIDSGIDPSHPDLSCAGKVLAVPGADLIGDGDGAYDANGHGTHVAGIIGACTRNGIGTVGVAPDATILPFRVLNEANEGYIEAIRVAIVRATDAGAHVINLSLSSGTVLDSIPGQMSSLDDAVRYAISHGVVVVAAAGNNAAPLCEYPAVVEGVICVGAIDGKDRRASYSNYPLKPATGETTTVVAPGGGSGGLCGNPTADVLSLWPPSLDTCDDGMAGYASISGTSMAAPHVSGIAALVYDRIGGARSAEAAGRVIDAILESAEDMGAPGHDPLFGYGLVDALGALTAAG